MGLFESPAPFFTPGVIYPSPGAWREPLPFFNAIAKNFGID
jgi:hypothetical protein